MGAKKEIVMKPRTNVKSGASSNKRRGTSGVLLIGLMLISAIAAPGQVIRTYRPVPPSQAWRVVAIGDFNGDGRADVFWYNDNTGETSAWLMNNSGDNISQIMTYYTVNQQRPSANDPAPSGWRVVGVGKFGPSLNYGNDEIFWFNTKTGETSAWLMNGTQTPDIATYTRVDSYSGWAPGTIGYTNSTSCTTESCAQTEVAASSIGYFDDYSIPTVFWYNNFANSTSGWQLEGRVVAKVVNYGQVNNSGNSVSRWVVVKVGNGEVFWWNVGTGETMAWLWAGSSWKQVSYLTVPRSSGWRPIGFGMFNSGSRGHDVFWYNDLTGATSAWVMSKSGDAISQTMNYATVDPSLGWKPVGLGDFNGDGITDVFWYNNLNGDTSAWLMASPPPTTLKVIVTVNNTAGGAALPSNFNVSVQGANASPSGFAGSSAGTLVSVDPNLTYYVNVATVANYTAGQSGNCSSSISPGATATCTVTETYVKPPVPQPPSVMSATAYLEPIRAPSDLGLQSRRLDSYLARSSP
jgi:hypothetical protein